MVEASKGRDTLGIALAPDGNIEDEGKLLKKKVEQWTSTVKSRSLLCGELFLGMNSIIMKTIEYLLYVTTFQREEMNHIIKPLHDLVLPQCKICRKISLVLRYGPCNSLRLGLHNPFIT